VNNPKPTIGRHVTPRLSELLRDHEGLRMAFKQDVRCVGQSSASVSPDRHLEPDGHDDRQRELMLPKGQDVSRT
jgi:hypothetical protein